MLIALSEVTNPQTAPFMEFVANAYATGVEFPPMVKPAQAAIDFVISSGLEPKKAIAKGNQMLSHSLEQLIIQPLLFPEKLGE